MLSIQSRSEVQHVKDRGLVARARCSYNRHAILITIQGGERQGLVCRDFAFNSQTVAI